MQSTNRPATHYPRTAMLTVLCSLTLVLTLYDQPLTATRKHANTLANQPGILSGRLTDPLGASLADARITVQHFTSSGRQPRVTVDAEAYSDGTGAFKISLPPGVYDVFVSALFFAPAAKRVRIESDKTEEMECELQFDRYTKWIQ